MDEFANDTFSDLLIEILPPDRDDATRSDAVACLCCRKMRSASAMDADGCGICEECLAP
jgi:hypothetical protein